MMGRVEEVEISWTTNLTGFGSLASVGFPKSCSWGQCWKGNEGYVRRRLGGGDFTWNVDFFWASFRFGLVCVFFWWGTESIQQTSRLCSQVWICRSILILPESDLYDILAVISKHCQLKCVARIEGHALDGTRIIPDYTASSTWHTGSKATNTGHFYTTQVAFSRSHLEACPATWCKARIGRQGAMEGLYKGLFWSSNFQPNSTIFLFPKKTDAVPLWRWEKYHLHYSLHLHLPTKQTRVFRCFLSKKKGGFPFLSFTTFHPKLMLGIQVNPAARAMDRWGILVVLQGDRKLGKGWGSVTSFQKVMFVYVCVRKMSEYPWIPLILVFFLRRWVKHHYNSHQE